MTESEGSQSSDSLVSMRSGTRWDIALFRLSAWLASTLYLNDIYMDVMYD